MMSLHFITNQRVRAIAAPQHRSAAFQAEPLRVSSLRAAATIAGEAAIIFLFVFALPALFGGL